MLGHQFTRLPDAGAPRGDESPLAVIANHAAQGNWISAVPGSIVAPAPWWQHFLRDGLPSPLAAWQIRLIPAGLWLYNGHPSVDEATRVARIPADRDRLALVVTGTGRDRGTLDAVAQLLSVLPANCPRAIRLFLPLVDPDVGHELAHEHRLDLVASPAGLHSQGELSYVSGFHSARPDAFWQWYRVGPEHPVQSCGALYPTPPWEEALTEQLHLAEQPAATVSRVPAGIAVRPLGATDTRFLAFAADVAPRADRLQVIVQANGIDPLLLAACTGLLDSLPTGATRQVQLVWPYAGTRDTSDQLRDLASLLEAPVLAPAAGLRTHRNGHDLLAVHGDGTLGHWVRFTADQPAQPCGPLSPPADWGRLLRPLLRGLPRDTPLVMAPAGLHLRGAEEPDLTVLADALEPQREGVTLLADGDAGRPADREGVLALLDRFGPALLTGIRVVMSSAADGESRSFAQALANRLRVRILVATSESIDDAVRDTERRSEPARLTWKRFLPRSGPLITAVAARPVNSPAATQP